MCPPPFNDNSEGNSPQETGQDAHAASTILVASKGHHLQLRTRREGGTSPVKKLVSFPNRRVRATEVCLRNVRTRSGTSSRAREQAGVTCL